jgi:hypothetical protein
MAIDKSLSVEILNSPGKIDLLKLEVANYLKIFRINQDEALLERSDHGLSPEAFKNLFRSKERNEKTLLTMQYLLAFLDHIPGPSEIEREPLNPVEQFREFIRYQAELLLEEDVKNAISKEVIGGGSLKGGKILNYQERIIVKNRKLLEDVAGDGCGIAKTIAALCQVLEDLCQFWFEIKHGDMRCTRWSDIYLYLLAYIVKNRCQQTAKEEIGDAYA